MPLANLTIKTKQMPFPSTVVPGVWGWSIIETEGVAGPAAEAAEEVTWSTVDPFTSVVVDTGRTYKVSGARFNKAGQMLGVSVSASFTTEDEPADIMIDVADTISVELS